MDRDDPAYAGQRDYNRLLLNAYDPLVLGPIARFIWKCPTTNLVERYRQHVRSNHLDVGPGTGYFLDRSGLPDGSPVTILDPNPDRPRPCLSSARATRRHALEADVLKPLRGRRAIRLRRTSPRDPLSTRSAVAQGRSRRQCRGRPRTSRRVVRCLRSRQIGEPHATGEGAPCRVQPSGRLRQPRRHEGGARRDPGGIVRAGRHRDHRLDRGLRSHGTASVSEDRDLHAFRDEGLVATTAGSIEILDVGRVAAQVGRWQERSHR